MPGRVATTVIEPMLLRTDKLPDDASRWEYQLKLDGYRAVAFTAEGRVHLQSRNGNDFGARVLYAARTRSGCAPATRAQLFKRFRALETRVCP
jgi:ATP-dependent DNA ligase